MKYATENTLLYLNGEFVKAAAAVTDLYGQTLHYGYGVFEGIRAYETPNGTKIFKGLEHYERLVKSAALIHIPLQYSPLQMLNLTYELLERNNLRNAYVRPLVFCSPNMSLTKAEGVSLMISCWEWGAYLGEKLLSVTISSYCRPHPRSIKVEAKVCGHYVNSILAVTEAKENGYDEALLLDCDGYLAEGPGSNLFFEKDGAIYTPQTGHILPGITRATIIELCHELGIEIREGRYTPDNLLNADSAFLCGTAAEVVGMSSINGNIFPKPWAESLGKTLQTAYKNRVLEHTLELHK